MCYRFPRCFLKSPEWVQMTHFPWTTPLLICLLFKWKDTNPNKEKENGVITKKNWSYRGLNSWCWQKWSYFQWLCWGKYIERQVVNVMTICWTITIAEQVPINPQLIAFTPLYQSQTSTSQNLTMTMTILLAFILRIQNQLYLYQYHQRISSLWLFPQMLFSHQKTLSLKKMLARFINLNLGSLQ